MTHWAPVLLQPQLTTGTSPVVELIGRKHSDRYGIEHRGVEDLEIRGLWFDSTTAACVLLKDRLNGEMHWGTGVIQSPSTDAHTQSFSTRGRAELSRTPSPWDSGTSICAGSWQPVRNCMDEAPLRRSRVSAEYSKPCARQLSHSACCERFARISMHGSPSTVCAQLLGGRQAWMRTFMP